MKALMIFVVWPLVGLAMWVAIFFVGYKLVRANHQSCVYSLTLPLTVQIESGVDAEMVRAAMAYWNEWYGAVFVETVGPATVTIRPSTQTWVDMPCGKATSIVYAGTDVDLSYWMAHELGHTLGFADHIQAEQDSTGYINPGTCPDYGYGGIMSYCSDSSKWFGLDDYQTMNEIFPRGLNYKQFVIGLVR